MDPGATAKGRLERALEGRYTLEREIGRGGMATVYLAHDIRHDRSVAIKILSEETGFEDAPGRFQREIHVTAGLVHPHILPLLDSGQAEGLPYYVMPHVEGESLRDRLEKEGRLSLDQAVRITGQVADALEHAHKHGLVHRDIKPANILLESGHAYLADFGIVRSDTPMDEGLTREGHVIGTPHYQSPEQWRGSAQIDGRSDLYSLGCVLFEMLAGEPPFRGTSPEAVAGKHLHEKPPPVSIIRHTISREMDRVIARAMAKDPADRFETASSFAEALREAHRTAETPRIPLGDLRQLTQWKTAAGVASVLTLVGVMVVTARGTIDSIFGPDTAPDTTRYAIFAVPTPSGVGTDLDVTQRLSRSLERWEGVTVAEPLADEEMRGFWRRGDPSDARLAGHAASMGIGRVVKVALGSVGSDYRVNVELLDAVSGGALLESGGYRLSADLSSPDSIFDEVADHLLFREALAVRDLPTSGSRSLAARHEFLKGWARLEAGDLIGADSAFLQATLVDPDFAEANLWVALNRAWRRLDRPHWRAYAQQAAGSQALSPGDRLMADAILAEESGDASTACGVWEELTREEPLYFGGWLGTGSCMLRDGLVVADPGSPSGWSFRTSYHHALSAYQKAFELFPAILSSYHEGFYSELRSLFFTSPSQRQWGVGEPPENRPFRARPAWRGDSLALVPYPDDAIEFDLPFDPQEVSTAVRRQRELLHDVVLGWVSADPAEADAYEALAMTLTLRSDPGALEMIRLARDYADTESEDLHLAGVEAWIQLALSLPDDMDGIRRTRSIVDSVLARATELKSSTDKLHLAGFSVLTGQAHRAAELVRSPGVGELMSCPPPLRADAPPLLIYAALGGPADTLAALEDRVRTGIQELLIPEDRFTPEDRFMARVNWLLRPATLAFFHHPMDAMETLQDIPDYILDFQVAISSGDTASVRSGFRRLADRREGLLPSRITLDTLVPEAELLLLLGDLEAAADALDPAFRALPQTISSMLTDPVQAAALARAVALRAVIAHELGEDATAAQWRGAIMTLWSDADPFLQPRLRELDLQFD